MLKHHVNSLIATWIFALLYPSFAFSENSDDTIQPYENCLLEQLRSADDELSIGEIRQRCLLKKTGHNTEPTNPATDLKQVGKVTNTETSSAPNPAITSKPPLYSRQGHHPSYLLFSHYSNPNNDPFREGTQLSDQEIKFQISFKSRIFDDFLSSGGDLYFGYTQLSFWQAFDGNASSPFRETNYEPEAWLEFPLKFRSQLFDTSALRLGFSHQSNGRGSGLSRSWNRLYADLHFSIGEVELSFKPWWRIPEDNKDYSNDPHGDDNPDIVRYMGYGEVTANWQWNEKNLIRVMMRNNLRSDNRGAIQIDYTRALNDHLLLHTQFFNGYGESLLDYNHSTSRFGVGFTLKQHFFENF